MKMAQGSGFVNGFGTTRLLLLGSFVLLACSTYFYMDTKTLQNFFLMVQEDPYGWLHIFMAVYTVSVVLLFPCMFMQVVSGALYGFSMGFVVSWVATSTGQALAFLLGRYLFRPTVKAYLHSTWPTFPAIDGAIKKEAWKLVCLLRLSPVLPCNILNYALAITPVSFFVFTTGSAVATVPWTALYVYLGTFSTNFMDLAQGKIEYSGDLHIWSRVLSGAFIVITTVYGYVLSQRAITAVLKDASEQEGFNSSNGVSIGSSSSSSPGGSTTGSTGMVKLGAGVSTAMSDRGRDIEDGGRNGL